MESFILLHNNLYPKSAPILMQTFKILLEKLQIPIEKSQTITLEPKFLPFIDRVKYYKKLLLLFLESQVENYKILLCDSQSLLEVQRFFEVLYEETDLRESLIKEYNVEIDILELENNFVFAPEVVLDALKTASFKLKRWQGFKCAFLVDRELQKWVVESKMLNTIEEITGLKILPFFKESYAYLLEVNPQLAYKMGGADYYQMVDSGVDFILTPNIGNFELMDRYSARLKNTSGRDDLEIPLLFIPQVILALFEDTTRDILYFREHNISPKML